MYLLELIVLFLALIVIQAFVPGLFDLDVFKLSTLFIAALAVPLVIMSIVAHSPLRGTYHYLFG